MSIRNFAVAAVAVTTLAGAAALHHSVPLNAATPVAMTTFNIDPAHSMMLFKVRHLGLSTVTGRFAKFAGTFQLDPATGQAGSASLKIETASVSTDNERRDGHLRSPDFFAADSFPQISFESTRIEKLSGNKYRMAGNLTIRGVTKPVTLEGELAGTRQTPQGWLAAVNLTGSVKRKEFGLMWDRLTEGVAVVSDDVVLQLEVEAKSAP
jgi:polyisoprenoid-binding protein YceI